MFKKVFSFILIATTAVAYEFENQNTVSLNTNYYLKSYGGADQIENHLFFLSENRLKITSRVDFFASPLFDVYTGSAEKKHLATADVKDFKFALTNKNISLDIGFFNVKKIGPDIIDPLGYFEPRDLTDVLNPRKMSLGGAQLEAEIFKNFIFTAVFVPQNRLSKLPRTTSMWYPRETKLPLTAADTKATLPSESLYQINNNGPEKNSDLKNNYLLQIKYSSGDLELDLQAAESISNVPKITPTLTGTLVSVNPTEIALQNPIELDILWKKNKNYGGGLSYSFTDTGIIARAFYNLNVTPDDETQQSVFALEKQFQDLIVIYEYSHSKSTQNQNTSSLVSAATLFENTHTLAARYSLTDKLKLKFAGYLDATSSSNLWLLNAEYHFSDDMYIEIQKTDITGLGNSLLSYYDKNDSYSLKVTSLF